MVFQTWFTAPPATCNVTVKFLGFFGTWKLDRLPPLNTCCFFVVVRFFDVLQPRPLVYYRGAIFVKKKSYTTWDAFFLLRNPQLHTLFGQSFLGFLALGNSSTWHLQTLPKKHSAQRGTRIISRCFTPLVFNSATHETWRCKATVRHRRRGADEVYVVYWGLQMSCIGATPYGEMGKEGRRKASTWGAIQ